MGLGEGLRPASAHLGDEEARVEPSRGAAEAVCLLRLFVGAQPGQVAQPH